MKKKQYQSGFTLIELMMTVAIIGILAAIAMPSFQNKVVLSQAMEGLTLSRGISRSIVDYYYERGLWPNEGDLNTDTGEIVVGIDDLGFKKTKSRYVSKIEATNGIVTVTYGNNLSAKAAGKTLTMTPATNKNGDVIWICSGGKVPSGLTTNTGITGGSGINLTSEMPATELSPTFLSKSCHP